MVANCQNLSDSLFDEFCPEQPIRRFCRENNVSVDYAKNLWLQLMRFFFVAKEVRKIDQNFQFPMFAGIGKIDEMWHTFLLYTKEYNYFCDKYLGYFAHHIPDPIDESYKRHGILNQEELEKTFQYIYDILGEEIFKEWILEKKYAREEGFL